MESGKSRKSSELKRSGIWRGLQTGLAKTRTVLFTDVTELFDSKDWSEQELLDEIETRLLMADVGVVTTAGIVEDLRLACSKRKIKTQEDFLSELHEIMESILAPVQMPLSISSGNSLPFIILVLGVNGSGKTTTIGKLANFYGQDYRVMLAAGDTYRAAAIEQLASWGERTKTPVIAHAHGGDSAAVIYDALKSARDQDMEIVIADTAGRLQTQANLMDELKKIRRTISKFDAGATVETLLVLDAGTGQNAVAQAQQFNAAVGVSGIALTKLDGTARGGVIFPLAQKLGIPLRFIGTGEKITDLSPFNAEDFVTALLSTEQ